MTRKYLFNTALYCTPGNTYSLIFLDSKDGIMIATSH